jgi:hypothetical protein
VGLDQALLSFAIGVFGSLVASFLFVVSMRRVGPRVRIGPTVQLNATRDKARLDVENRSRATLRDVEVALFVGYPEHPGPPGRKVRWVSPRRKVRLVGYQRRKGHGRATVHFTLAEELQPVLVEPEENLFLEFRLTAEHPTSGVTREFERMYGIADLEVVDTIVEPEAETEPGESSRPSR